MHIRERSTKQRLTIYSSLAATSNNPYTCIIQNTGTNTYILKPKIFRKIFISEFINLISYQTCIFYVPISAGLLLQTMSNIWCSTVHFFYDCLIVVQLGWKVPAFISVFNQLDAQNLFHNMFYFMPLHVSSTCAHHQEVKIALHSFW